MRRTIEALLAVCLLLLGAVPALAQDIVQLNKDGIEAFTDGRFEEAARKFGEAYAIEPEPALKKNEAVAWFKAKNCERALPAADEYLALGIDNELSKREAQTVAARCNIKRAEAAFVAGDLAGASAALVVAESHNPEEEDTREIARIRSGVDERRNALEQERIAAMEAAEARAAEERAQKSGQSKLLGLGLAGAGGAIVLGTLVYHLTLATGTSKNFRAASAAGDRDEYERLGRKLETGNWLVPTLYAVGLVTAGVGVYLWWSTSDTPQTAAGATRFETVGMTARWAF